MPRILALAGSTRTGSLNRRLVGALATAARAAGAEVTVVDLKDFEMPIYNGDLEAASGLPEAALRFKAVAPSYDGWIVSTPEYNGSVPALLKNFIDWTSRAHEAGENRARIYQGVPIMLVSASPGPGGGARARAHVAAFLQAMGAKVLPEHVSVKGAEQALTPDGEPATDELREAIAELGRVLAGLG